MVTKKYVTEEAKLCPMVKMNEKKKWYAVYTRPRWEKKVHQLLSEKGLESYCPLNKVKRQWSDRIKTVEEPLFKSYVFVRISDDERTSVRMTEGVVNFIYWLGKPAVISNRDIDLIKRFLNEHPEVIAEPLDIKENDLVQVSSGLFADEEAKVLQVRKKMVELRIESINYRITAWVEKKKIILKKTSPSKTIVKE